ncbi:MAG: ligase-associated DNA damage response exonuclease [Verrucomicrobiae bacterium]|nr:ligase-associated DNA damage response exonuclease [Verrucomicrobiae bacterium]
MEPLLEPTPQGLYCKAGGFHVDPWSPVDRAIVSHAHSDHAREGSKAYLTSQSGRDLLALRVGSDAPIETLRYGETRTLGEVTVSLHPAGHILGSSQVRLECGGEVWVFSGDYKRQLDPTCEPFEPQRCHTFITEATFALPIYRWSEPEETFDEINAWWRANQAAGRTSVIFAYALGKAQHVLAGLDPEIGPIAAHGMVGRYVPAYAAAGVVLPEVRRVERSNIADLRGRAVVLATPSVLRTPWLDQLEPFSTAFASGWMQIRGARRRRAVDRGFALSDHADWGDLIRTIRETKAERIGVTHGYTATLARWLQENQWNAFTVPTQFEGELQAEADEVGAAAEGTGAGSAA